MNTTQTENGSRPVSTVQYLRRPEGRIAFDTTGNGPLLVCLPGMGDLRSSYRFLTPVLAGAGFRVVTADLRGHGDSDATFSAYGDSETASDLIALLEHLGTPAVVIGNSMAAGAAVLGAAERPDLFTGLVLVGPFVRNPPTSAAMRILLRIAMATPVAAATWKAYLPTLYKGRRPHDFAAYRAAVVSAIRRPGYAAAFSRTTRTSHAAAEAAISGVHTPTLVVMGELDPDFADPAAEADWIAGRLGGQVVMVPDAGHYPQAQQPAKLGTAIEEFMAGLAPRA